MKCSLCEQPLFVKSGKIIVEDELVYSPREFMCTNPKCQMYAGKDLDNPDIIAHSDRVLLNP